MIQNRAPKSYRNRKGPKSASKSEKATKGFSVLKWLALQVTNSKNKVSRRKKKSL